ncbi:6-phosphogluconolactonase [Chitinivorax sp. PXF-14]|uniref:6-phosphogluconolactonase n=1 Tax=Chitinivorax sp. PXF-14 TaxID=3230488 RepID=UPI003467D4C8
MLTEHLFDQPAELDTALASRIATLIRDAVALRGQASLALSGGRTPQGFFKALAALPLPWESVWITLVDDRWVPNDHADSNERLVRAGLLQGPVAAAHFIPMVNAAATPEAGLAEARAALAALPQPFDAIVLGMGDDGHTASLFPGADELAHGLSSTELVCAVNPKHAPHARISLTAPTILAARHLFLHITGDNKRKVLAEARTGGAVEAMPIRATIQQDKVPLNVYWSA